MGAAAVVLCWIDVRILNGLMRDSADKSEEVAITPVLTLVLWTVCAAVGLMGIWIPYGRPGPVVKAARPVEARVMNVNVVEGHSSPPVKARIAEVEQPPEPMRVAAPPAEVGMKEVAVAPGPMAEVKRISPVVAATAADAAPGPEVRPLTYGEGEGRQPPPEYPREAVLEREEGTVMVRFTVDEAGEVTGAQASGPCRFAVLNQAAVRAVRETWHFSHGAVRTFEVAIRFELSQ
jgi:TonB family protein